MPLVHKLSQQTSDSTNGGVRQFLAVAVVLLGFASAIAIALAIVYYAKADEKSEAAQLVLSTILPVIGTWVGTILAFYFAKDNLEAATRSTRELLGLEARLRSIPVTEAMITPDVMNSMVLGAGEKVQDVKIQDILGELDRHGRNRLPIQNNTRAVLLVVHRSIPTEYVTDKLFKAKADLKAIEALTVANLKQDAPALYRKAEAMAFVSRTASMADAKREMEKIQDCADVFVTESGQKDKAVVGWITNLEISLKSRAD